MARASVTTQTITRAGLSAALTGPPADGDIIDAGPVILEVANGSGGAITVTVLPSFEAAGLELEPLEVSVPASGTREIGPFPPAIFAQLPDAEVGPGRVLVDYSAVASVTRCVKKLGS